jgi:hypothetical protein
MPDTGTIVSSVTRKQKDLLVFEFDCVCSGTDLSVTTPKVEGDVAQIIIIPGSPTPTASFGLTIKDEDLVDIAGGALTAIPVSAPSQYFPKWGGNTYGPRRCDSTLVIAISANSQSGAKVNIKLYVTPPKNLFQ